MSINWVNWLILISCFLNLTRDSASLGKHTILQQDQKQRKPDNKSFWFQGMFTRQTFNILAEVKQRTEFAKKGLLRAVLMLEISQKGLYTPREKKQNKTKTKKDNQPLWIWGTCIESVDLGGSRHPSNNTNQNIKYFCKETFLWKLFTVTVFKIQTNNHNDILGLDHIVRWTLMVRPSYFFRNLENCGVVLFVFAFFSPQALAKWLVASSINSCFVLTMTMVKLSGSFIPHSKDQDPTHKYQWQWWQAIMIANTGCHRLTIIHTMLSTCHRSLHLIFMTLLWVGY